MDGPCRPRSSTFLRSFDNNIRVGMAGHIGSTRHDVESVHGLDTTASRGAIYKWLR
jgi:hypothetical protein